MAIHPTAVVAPGAELAPDVEVGPFAVIEEETAIGPGCEIRAHAVVKRYTRMGERNLVCEGAVLGGEPQDFHFGGEASALVIGDDNRFREGVTVHRSSVPGAETRVGSGGFFMACSHIAHDCRIGDGVVMANNVALAGHVTIGERAFLSGGVVVHQFSRIGRLAMVGGNAKVTQDCLPFVTTDGVPARAKGLNAVGLRRAGWKAAELRPIKEAYRILLRSALPLETALGRIAELGDRRADELAAFVRGSERGFHREALQIVGER